MTKIPQVGWLKRQKFVDSVLKSRSLVLGTGGFSLLEGHEAESAA